MKRALPLLVLILCPLTVGCAPKVDDPRTWDQAKMESKLKKTWDLSEVSLTPAEDGFTGTGKNAEQETFKITVKHDKAAPKTNCDALSDRGSFLEADYDATPAAR